MPSIPRIPRIPRFSGSGYLLPTAAAATLALTATGAHLGSAATAGTSSTPAPSAAAAVLAASGMATEDPIHRDLQDRAARGSARTTAATSDAATDATPQAEDPARFDAAAAGAAKALADSQAQADADAAAAATKAEADAQAQADAEAAAKAQADAQAKAQAEADAQAKAAAAAHSWVAPLDGGFTLTSGFGVRWGAMHPGQDFAVPTGTPVKAMSTGTVILAGWSGGYGNKVEIRYWDGTVSWFAHNSRLLVSVGDTVTPGEVVALSGSTGHSTGPHVHVEIHPAGGGAVSPMPWFRAKGVNV